MVTDTRECESRNRGKEASRQGRENNNGGAIARPPHGDCSQMTTPDGRKPTFPLLAWLLQALAPLTAYFLGKLDGDDGDESDNGTDAYLVEDDDDYKVYVFPHTDASMLAAVGDVETVVAIGYDPADSTLVAIVAKPGTDTASIKASLGDDIKPIVAIRPHLMGTAFVSMEDGGQYEDDAKFAAIVKAMIASGFVPAEGFNSRHTVPPQKIEAVMMATAIDAREPDFFDKPFVYGQKLVFNGETVRFLQIVFGRFVVVTDTVAMVTRRMSAEMLADLMESGIVKDEWVLYGNSVGLDAAPISLIGNGASTIIGLSDHETNIAIDVSPNGSIEVVKITGTYGTLVSLFAKAAEMKTGTAIVESSDGTLGRVSLAALSPAFRTTARITLEGNGTPQPQA